MTFRQARDLFEYWKVVPPVCESVSLLLKCYTTWEPEIAVTEEQAIATHRHSLEQRWRAGAMNPKQLYEAMGGKTGAIGFNGTVQPAIFPGIGPFPGAPKTDGQQSPS